MCLTQDDTSNPLYNTVFGSKAETVLVKQLCYIKKKKCIDLTFQKWSFIYIIYIFFASIFKPCFIQNSVVTNCVVNSSMYND